MTVHIGQDDCIVTITIDRERKLNALDYPTIDALLAALDRIDCDDCVRAVVVTGAGRRAFSAGADIPSLAASIGGGTERALREIVRRGHALTRRIEEFPKPVIVAVNGLAYGAGCEITEAARGGPIAWEAVLGADLVPEAELNCHAAGLCGLLPDLERG